LPWWLEIVNVAAESNNSESPERVVQIRRCACVVKGGRRFSFTALVVVGDGQGRVGYGYGKAIEVPLAVEKAVKAANKNMIRCPLTKNSIPHQVIGKFGSSQVMLMPANPGTGIIAGACVRAVAESLGLTDVLSNDHHFCLGGVYGLVSVDVRFACLDVKICDLPS